MQLRRLRQYRPHILPQLQSEGLFDLIPAQHDLGHEAAFLRVQRNQRLTALAIPQIPAVVLPAKILLAGNGIVVGDELRKFFPQSSLRAKRLEYCRLSQLVFFVGKETDGHDGMTPSAVS